MLKKTGIFTRQLKVPNVYHSLYMDVRAEHAIDEQHSSRAWKRR